MMIPESIYTRLSSSMLRLMCRSGALGEDVVDLRNFRLSWERTIKENGEIGDNPENLVLKIVIPKLINR